MTEQELERIEERWSKASKGGWLWEINPKYKTVSLRSRAGMIVMDFVRWGMGSAAPRFLDESHLLHRVDKLMEPIPGREHHSHWAQQINHPDALAIAAAPEDVRDLIAEVRRLNAEVEGLKSAVHEPGAPELSAPEAKEFKTFVAKLKHIGDMLPSTFTSKD